MITDPKQAGKYIFGVVRLSDKGQIVIPKEAREVFGLKPGDSMLLFGDINQGLALCKTEVFQPFAERIFQSRGTEEPENSGKTDENSEDTQSDRISGGDTDGSID